MLGTVKVHPAKTLDQLAIDISTLHTDSHQTVVMECLRCGEVLKREYRLRSKLHQCKDAHGHDGWTQRLVGLLTRNLLRLTDHSVRLECLLDHPDAIVPTRTRATDAGYDLYSIMDKSLAPGEVTRIETGIRLAAPGGWYYTIDGRSSVWSQEVITFRGIIDGGYVGLIGVHLMNASKSNTYEIKKGDRIAQIILHKINHMDLVPVTEFSPSYNHRGTNGFGSTGK